MKSVHCKSQTAPIGNQSLEVPQGLFEGSRPGCEYSLTRLPANQRAESQDLSAGLWRLMNCPPPPHPPTPAADPELAKVEEEEEKEVEEEETCMMARRRGSG